MDAQLKIWSAEDASCVATFKGLHRGDCGSSINGVAVGAADNSINLGSPEQIPSERKVGTEAKMLLVAQEDKKLQCLGLQSRQLVFLFIGSDAFNCCTFLSGFLVLAGTRWKHLSAGCEESESSSTSPPQIRSTSSVPAEFQRWIHC
ncbi:Proteasomal ATPase-associated factor 1 [Heterocephalus glaber]|uniref:Proteasomal ATPase-associated factor 1 n=1 Tax=Heterocephalus glaber TaxID=10181 RepID=G5B509_HETGA|nr:Proteasomal ATPase-associated factor 1 [Heterocephalus glaber]